MGSCAFLLVVSDPSTQAFISHFFFRSCFFLLYLSLIFIFMVWCIYLWKCNNSPLRLPPRASKWRQQQRRSSAVSFAARNVFERGVCVLCVPRVCAIFIYYYFYYCYCCYFYYVVLALVSLPSTLFLMAFYFLPTSTISHNPFHIFFYYYYQSWIWVTTAFAPSQAQFLTSGRWLRCVANMRAEIVACWNELREILFYAHSFHLSFSSNSIRLSQ